MTLWHAIMSLKSCNNSKLELLRQRQPPQQLQPVERQREEQQRQRRCDQRR